MKKLVAILFGLVLSGPAFAQSSYGNNPLNAAGSIDATDIGENAVTAEELSSGVIANVVICGQMAENGTIYLGPALGSLAFDGTDNSISSTVCDALDNATEATADLPVNAASALKILGMQCQLAGTLGASETATFTLRSAEADITPSVTCSLAVGETLCSTATSSTTDVAAGATLAVEAVQSSNNTDDDGWCQVTYALLGGAG